MRDGLSQSIMDQNEKDWKTMYVIIDGNKIHTRDELHDAFAQALHLDEEYGRNLDALYDVLSTRFAETNVRICDPDALKENLGPYADRFFDMLLMATEENHHVTARVRLSREAD